MSKKIITTVFVVNFAVLALEVGLLLWAGRRRGQCVEDCDAGQGEL